MFNREYGDMLIRQTFPLYLMLIIGHQFLSVCIERAFRGYCGSKLCCHLALEEITARIQ